MNETGSVADAPGDMIVMSSVCREIDKGTLDKIRMWRVSPQSESKVCYEPFHSVYSVIPPRAGHWVVQLGMMSDRYVLIRKYLTMIIRRGGGGGARAPADETDVCCAQLDDFDWVVPDRVPDMLVSGCAKEECLSDLRHVDEILPDVFLVISTGATALPVSLPMVDEMVSSAVFVEGAAPVVVSFAEEEIFIVGMVGLIEAGSELPVDLLDSERVSQDCCVVDIGMVVPEQSPVVSVRVAAVLMHFPAGILRRKLTPT